MAIIHFSIQPRTTYGDRVGQKAVQYLVREGPYAPQKDVQYLQRTSEETQSREDLVWQHTANMPTWAQNNPEHFFETAMIRERVNGRWAVAMHCTLPRELNREQQIALTQDFLKAHIAHNPYVVVMHEPRTKTGELQPHIHVLFSERTLDGIARDEHQFFKRADKHFPERGGTAKVMCQHFSGHSISLVFSTCS